MKVTEGKVIAPNGFYAVGSHIGIKRKRKDLTIYYSKYDCNAAAVFTRNALKAAPLLWNKKILDSGNKIRAIVINSGNANACTGEIGKVHAQQMAQDLAGCLNLNKEEVFVASTGIIGQVLPINLISKGIQDNIPALDNREEAFNDAAEGILTTDTFTKQITIELELFDKPVKIVGQAKGSGMIHPNMATMLSFLFTDANIGSSLLQKMLKESVDDSYNMISVDGDTSTNDMVVLLANGKTDIPEIMPDSTEYDMFKQALDKINRYLAKQIIKDGEGATKFIEIHVRSANSKEDAKKMCKAVINSSLVKTAFFGEDANWGRIVAAMGYSGVKFDFDKINVLFKSNAGEITLVDNGKPIEFNEDRALEILEEKEIKAQIDLNQGTAETKAWGCDLSYEYVKINGEYRS